MRRHGPGRAGRPVGPQGGGDLRTRPQRYHDALAEARRLLASDLLPKRAGQPVKALVRISFVELCEMDAGSVLQDKWMTEYRAQWAAQRAAASVTTGDGGAWMEGDAARAIACDAMIVPVVPGDIDAGAIDELVALCVRYHGIRARSRVAGGHFRKETRSALEGGGVPPHTSRAIPGPPAFTTAMLSSRVVVDQVVIVEPRAGCCGRRWGARGTPAAACVRQQGGVATAGF